MPEVVAPQGAPAPAEDPAAKVEAIGSGLAELAQLTESSGAPDSAKAALKAALEAFSAFAQELQGGGQEEVPQEAPVDSMGGQGVPMDNRRPV